MKVCPTLTCPFFTRTSWDFPHTCNFCSGFVSSLNICHLSSSQTVIFFSFKMVYFQVKTLLHRNALEFTGRETEVLLSFGGLDLRLEFIFHALLLVEDLSCDIKLL